MQDEVGGYFNMFGWYLHHTCPAKFVKQDSRGN